MQTVLFIFLKIYSKILRYFRALIIWYLANFNNIPNIFSNVINQSDLADDYKPDDKFQIISVVLAYNNGFKDITRLVLALAKFNILDGGTLANIVSRKFGVVDFEIIIDVLHLEIESSPEIHNYCFENGVCKGNFGIFPLF